MTDRSRYQQDGGQHGQPVQQVVHDDEREDELDDLEGEGRRARVALNRRAAAVALTVGGCGASGRTAPAGRSRRRHRCHCCRRPLVADELLERRGAVRPHISQSQARDGAHTGRTRRGKPGQARPCGDHSGGVCVGACVDMRGRGRSAAEGSEYAAARQRRWSRRAHVKQQQQQRVTAFDQRGPALCSSGQSVGQPCSEAEKRAQYRRCGVQLTDCRTASCAKQTSPTSRKDGMGDVWYGSPRIV